MANFDDLYSLAGLDPFLAQSSVPAAEEVAAIDPMLAPTALQSGEGLTPPTMPPLPDVPPDAQMTSSSVSEGSTGLDPQMLEYLSNGAPARGLEGKYRDIKNKAMGRAILLGENMRPAFEAQERAVNEQSAAKQASLGVVGGDPDAAKAAVQGMADEVGLPGVQTTGAAQMAIAQAGIAAEEQKLGAQAVAKVTAAHADYTAQLERVRSMRIEPFKLFADDPLAFGLQNVTASMLMISGKPGNMAAGKALQQGLFDSLQRHVDGQLQNLANEQKVLDGFETIYGMVVKENDTAAQARTKVMSAYLAAMEGYVEAEAAKVGTKVEQANATKLTADIFAKRKEYENEVIQDQYKVAQEDSKMALQKYMSDQQASIAKQQMAHAEKMEALKVEKEKAKAKSDFIKDVNTKAISDPFTGKVIAWSPETENAKAMQGMSADLGHLLPQVERLKKLSDEAAKAKNIGDVTNYKRLSSTIKQQASTLQTLIVPVLAKTLDPTSRGVTDMEQLRAEMALAFDDGYWLNSPDEAYAQIGQNLTRRWVYNMNQKAIPIDKLDDDVRGAIAERFQFSDMSQTGKDALGGFEEQISPKPKDEQQLKYEGAVSLQKEGVHPRQPSQTPDWFKQYAESWQGKEIGKKPVKDVYDRYQYPEWADAVYETAYAASQGDQRAKRFLNDLASDTSDRLKEQREMALYFLRNPPTEADESYMLHQIDDFIPGFGKKQRSE